MTQYPRQGRLELLLGLLHLLLVGALLPKQPADVAVGRLDHGVEVVGVAAVDLAALHPGQQHSHRVRERPVVWPGREEEEEEGRARNGQHIRVFTASLRLRRLPKQQMSAALTTNFFLNII